MTNAIPRRRLLNTAAASTAGWLLLRNARSARSYWANQKLNIALVGVGGRGTWFVGCIPQIGENVVAMCDANQQRAAESFKKLPGMPKFRDWREMLDRMDRQIEAVIIAVPDHNHAPISMGAIKRGKHVYCEKPLTHDVGEARALRLAAKQHPVATQMGNQGTATEAFRRGVELIQAGALGTVEQVYVWKDSGGSGPRPLPQGEQPVPEWLDWDVWLGPAATRPFHSDWLGWHAWRDFATGQLGNWGSHSANMAFMGLRIDSLWSADGLAAEARQIRVRAEVAHVAEHAFPRWEIIRYEIPARGDMPPVLLTWFNGAGSPGQRDRVEQLMGKKLDWGDAGRQKWDDHAGALIVGASGMIHTTGHNSTFTLLPEEKFRDFEGPPKTLSRSGSHEREWIEACKGGPQAMSHFGYSGPLTELLMLGNVATRFPEPLVFDPVAGAVVNHQEANQALMRQYREGWAL